MVFAELLGTIGDAVGTAAEGYLMSRPLLGTAIRAGLNEGLSGRQILTAFRAAGGTTSNASFWSLRGEIMGATNKFAKVAQLLSGDTSAVQEIAGGKAGSYRVDYRGYYEKVDEDGNVERGYQQFSLHQRQLDMGSGFKDAWSLWSDNSDTDSFPGQLLGLEVTGVYQYLGS